MSDVCTLVFTYCQIMAEQRKEKAKVIQLYLSCSGLIHLDEGIRWLGREGGREGGFLISRDEGDGHTSSLTSTGNPLEDLSSRGVSSSLMMSLMSGGRLYIPSLSRCCSRAASPHRNGLEEGEGEKVEVFMHMLSIFHCDTCMHAHM